ncbi:hypothetical protein LSTR_LSTR013924 [Laodelphax striatellus]|uniref:Protein kinase domain-containing protein n=1 Tax=Laodelphax striatellus TaxID=195883 RepID=A0A482XKB9_LAOST|nr:hypothetical protein LSTR_LSTR013924 [Laodelphax striatellus]
MPYSLILYEKPLIKLVFSEIQIMFSIGGKIYSGNPISFMYMEDRIFEYSRNVSIKLHHRVGKYVKLRMQFAAKWIMISEVTFDSDVSHEYAVPEVGIGNGSAGSTLLIGPKVPPPSLPPARGTAPRTVKPPNQQDVMSALRRRLETNVVPEFPRHRVRMLSKLGQGAYRAVYIAEADGISDYGGSSSSNGKKLVAVRSLLHNATEADRMSFEKDIHILGALEDENIARVLGVCSKEEPLCAIMEYLPQGELCRFLRAHALMPGDRTLPVGHKTLSFNCLLYMATQIASGMRYLESLNFVHKDLAARNCLVGKAYQIKISDLGAENDEYANDYYTMDNGDILPIRWMAWESIRLIIS